MEEYDFCAFPFRTLLFIGTFYVLMLQALTKYFSRSNLRLGHLEFDFKFELVNYEALVRRFRSHINYFSLLITKPPPKAV